MRIGVVILNYMDFQTTIACALKTEEFDSINVIVVVDNDSPNNSFLEMKNKFIGHEKIVLLKSENNKGYSYGNNVGLNYLWNNKICDIVGIINPDVVLNKKLLKNVLHIFECDIQDKYGILTGIQLNHKSEVARRGCWKYPNAFSLIIENSILLSFIKDKYFNKRKQYIYDENGVIDVDVVEGCCFFIKINVFKSIDFFDENLFLFFEENVLSYKLKMIKKRVGIIKKCNFIHHHSTTINNTCSFVKQKKLLYNSRTYFFFKYLQPKYEIYKVLFYITGIILDIELFLYKLYKNHGSK